MGQPWALYGVNRNALKSLESGDWTFGFGPLTVTLSLCTATIHHKCCHIFWLIRPFTTVWVFTDSSFPDYPVFVAPVKAEQQHLFVIVLIMEFVELSMQELCSTSSLSQPEYLKTPMWGAGFLIMLNYSSQESICMKLIYMYKIIRLVVYQVLKISFNIRFYTIFIFKFCFCMYIYIIYSLYLNNSTYCHGNWASCWLLKPIVNTFCAHLK